MVYLGHFSFIEHEDGEINHGLFTAVVTADDIDTATVKFHALLDRKQKETGLFDKCTFVFLENIVGVLQVPAEGFIAHHMHYEGVPPASMSTSLPGVPAEACESYRPYPEFEPGDLQSETDIVPFMTIGG